MLVQPCARLQQMAADVGQVLLLVLEHGALHLNTWYQTINVLCGGHLVKGASIEEHSASTYSAKKVCQIAGTAAVDPLSCSQQAIQAAMQKLKQNYALSPQHIESANHALKWTLKEALSEKWEASEEGSNLPPLVELL